MAAERAIQRNGGRPGIGGVLIGLGLAALVAIAGFIALSAHKQQALRTDAVTSAASSLAASPPPPASPRP